MTIAGAKVSGDGVIETYDNDDEALDAADDGVAVCTLSCLELLPFVLLHPLAFFRRELKFLLSDSVATYVLLLHE